ncbi:MAG: hypothetical protein ACLPTQ_05515, partial [Terriglobales bacterium]
SGTEVEQSVPGKVTTGPTTGWGKRSSGLSSCSFGCYAEDLGGRNRNAILVLGADVAKVLLGLGTLSADAGL